MDRFKSPKVQNDAYMLRAMTYGDLNGVRCGRDRSPRDAKWSSYHYYAYGKEDALVTVAPSYLTLGETPKERQRAYRGMVHVLMERDGINISHTCFIGDPEWVMRQYKILTEEMKSLVEKRCPYSRRASSNDPP